jgi:hypothetical protein
MPLSQAIHLCVLLWPRTGREADLVAYEDRVLQFLADYGATVIQRARSQGDGSDPLEIQLLSFPNEDALREFMTDDRRVAMTEERDRAIERTDVIRVAIS